MIDPASLTVFFAASILLALAPGPDNLFVLTQSLAGGRQAGLIITLGLCSGLIVHLTLVALGVAAIIKASDIAFTALKMAGAGYLIYLAWQSFRASRSDVYVAGGERLSQAKLYRRGIIMNVSNPKVTMFFLAFFPQFIEPEFGPVVVQIILLGGVFIMATLIIFGSVATLAGRVGGWLNRSKNAQVWLYRASGVLFLALATNLIVAQR